MAKYLLHQCVLQKTDTDTISLIFWLRGCIVWGFFPSRMEKEASACESDLFFFFKLLLVFGLTFLLLVNWKSGKLKKILGQGDYVRSSN